MATDRDRGGGPMTGMTGGPRQERSRDGGATARSSPLPVVAVDIPSAPLLSVAPGRGGRPGRPWRQRPV